MKQKTNWHILLFIFCTFFVAGSLLSEIYSYTDASGQRHYVDDLKKIPSEYKDNVKDSSSLPQINRFKFQAPSAAVKNKPSGKVEVFVTSWCGYCRAAEDYLSRRKIPYARRDIDKDKSAEAEYKRLGGGGVPIIKIGQKIIHGFDAAALDGALQ